MKILFLSSYAHLVLDPDAERVSGGAELQVALLARELAGRGHEVVVVGGDIGQADGVAFDGVRTRTGGKFHTGGLADAVRALPRVVSVLREERPEIVAVLGWTAWLYLLAKLRRVLGFRLAFICGLDTEVNGEFRKENSLRGALFERGIELSDLRFAMSGYQAAQFARRGERCALYRNLILPRVGAVAGDKPVDLLWVARCQPIKCPDRFLDLVEEFPNSMCEMICPREDVELWERISDRASRLPNLEFVERVPYREIQARYDRAKIFVNTSRFEGWPNSFIQAGLGRAALLSLDVNPDELFESFEPGVFAKGDFGRLVDGARAMLADEQLLGGAQAACSRFVAELHDNVVNVDAFLAGLDERNQRLFE